MTEPIFFEVPIYRCSRAIHTKEMQLQQIKIVEAIPEQLYPVSHQGMLNHFHSSIWYTWKYNEIIGHLNLYILGGQFRADVFMVDKKRMNKGIRKKKFKLIGKTLECHIPRNKSSEEIFEFMLDQLQQLNKREYKRYYFDLKTLKVAGRFINWLELVNKLNSYKYPEFRRAYFESED